MTLKATLSPGEFDALPETIELSKADLYRANEAGDALVLSVTPVGGWSLEDVGGLKRTAEDRRTKHSKAQQELEAMRAQYAELTEQLDGLDLDAARKALERPPAGKETAAQLEALRKDLTTKHEAERTKLESAAKRYRAQLEAKLIDAEAAQLLGNRESGLSGSFDLLRAPIRDRVRVIEDEETGDLSLSILDKNGEQMYAPAANKTVVKAGMKDLLKSLKEESSYQRAFDGTGASGGGAGGAGRTPSGKASVNGSLPPEDRLAAAWAGTGRA